MLSWFTPSCLSAQRVAFGVKGGIDIIGLEFNNDVFDKSNRAGVFIGPTFVISTALPGFKIDVSALYDQLTLKVDGQSLKQQSILLPAHVRYGASIANFGEIYVCIGPQLSFNVGAAKYYWEDASNNGKYFSLQDTKLSVDFGAGVSIGNHLEANVYYRIPLGKTADFTWNEAVNQTTTAIKSTKTTSEGWSISVTYLF